MDPTQNSAAGSTSGLRRGNTGLSASNDQSAASGPVSSNFPAVTGRRTAGQNYFIGTTSASNPGTIELSGTVVEKEGMNHRLFKAARSSLHPTDSNDSRIKAAVESLDQSMLQLTDLKANQKKDASEETLEQACQSFKTDVQNAIDGIKERYPEVEINHHCEKRSLAADGHWRVLEPSSGRVSPEEISGLQEAMYNETITQLALETLVAHHRLTQAASIMYLTARARRIREFGQGPSASPGPGDNFDHYVDLTGARFLDDDSESEGEEDRDRNMHRHRRRQRFIGTIRRLFRRER